MRKSPSLLLGQLHCHLAAYVSPDVGRTPYRGVYCEWDYPTLKGDGYGEDNGVCSVG